MAEESNALSIISTAAVMRTRIDQSGTPLIPSAMVSQILDIDATAPSERSRILLARMEKNLIAEYDSLIRKAETESLPPLLPSNTDCRGWISKECKVQRFWDSNHDNPVSRYDLEADFLDEFLRGTKLNSDSYRATLHDSNLSWSIRVEGLPDSVKFFCTALDMWLSYKINHHNFKLTVEKGEPVNIKFDPLKPLGANLVQVRHHNGPLGLLIESKEQSASQFADQLGTREYVCATVGYVKTVGDAPMTTFKFKELVEAAKQNGTGMDFTIKCLPAEYSGLLWCREERDDSFIKPETDAIHKGPRTINVLSASSVEQSGFIPARTTVQKMQEQQVGKTKQGAAMNLQQEQIVAFGTDGNELREDSIVSSHTSLEADSGTQRSGDYSTFYDKLSSLVEQEFRDGGNIHKNSAMGILWMRHKKMFGLACSDSCPCVQRLCELTETVVTDMLRKKHSRWGNPMNLRPGDYPVGIAGNFAATFLPLLRQERPHEGASRLLERLLFMWQIHQKQRIFGLKCQQGCLCVQGWEMAFQKGTLPRESKPPIELEKGNNNTLGPVPKKRSAANVFIEPAIEKKSKLLFDTGRQTGQPRPLVGSECSADHSTVMTQSYEIAFDCCRPLGFYCVTEKQPRKYCKVM